MPDGVEALVGQDWNPKGTNVHTKPTTGPERRKDGTPTVTEAHLFLLARLLTTLFAAQAAKAPNPLGFLISADLMREQSGGICPRIAFFFRRCADL